MNDALKIKKENIFSKLGHWIKRHRTASIAIGGAVLVVIAFIVAYILVFSKAPPSNATVYVPSVEKPVVYYSNLTGLKVCNEPATKQAVTAVMLENSPSARPQSGLKEAGVVFEAVAEGGITRFLALYQQEKPKLVGPVRSLRMYYVDWLAPFNASIAHVGGSAKALKEIRNGSYRDIDQFFNGQFYWRATDRYAPHNVYTNFKKLDELNKSKKYLTSKFTGFKRADEKPAEKVEASNIKIDISGPLYDTSYKYDKKKNQYTRYLAGELHKDREKGNITPKVVIAMMVDMTRVFEDGYRESIKTIGSGKVTIFQNGTAIKGTWHKKNRESQIVFKDSKGKEVELVRGQTWITAVPNGSGGVSWK